MDSMLVTGLSLMGVYVVGQLAFIVYSQASYQKLRNDIIAKGRLISLLPVLTLTTVASLAGTSDLQPRMAGAPPGYTPSPQNKGQPPPPYVESNTS